MYIKNRPSRFVEILIHIMVWTILFSSPFLFMPNDINESWLFFYSRFCFSQLIVIIIFYSNYFLLINKYLFDRKVRTFLTINIIAIIAGSVLMYLVDDVFVPIGSAHHGSAHPGSVPPGEKPPIKLGWMLKIGRDTIFYILTAGLSVAIKMTSQWYSEESQRKELEKNHYEAELKNLKSQLNPHFLFNTLNNIYSLVAISQDRAQSAIHQLSKLLRYVLYDNYETEVPLSKEIEFINNYLDLVKLRFSSKADISFEIKGEPSEWNIAPMLFISLIENAFKHGINGSGKSFVHINLFVDNEKLLFDVANSYFYKHSDDRSGSGIGLDNLRTRLAISYGKNASFTAGRKDDKFMSEIRILRKNIISHKKSENE